MDTLKVEFEIKFCNFSREYLNEKDLMFCFNEH